MFSGLRSLQSREQPGREMPQGRSDGARSRANDNSRTVNGAYPARRGETLGCNGPEALLQALDLFEPLGERPKLGNVAEEFRDGF